jgi:hypothetical protein
VPRNHELLVDEVGLREKGAVSSARRFPYCLVEQFDHHPLVILLPLRFGVSGTLQCFQIQPGDLLEVRNGDSDHSAVRENAVAFSQQPGAVLEGKMFEDMGVIHDVQRRVRKRQTVTNVMRLHVRSRRLKVDVDPIRMESGSTPDVQSSPSAQAKAWP